MLPFLFDAARPKCKIAFENQNGPTIWDLLKSNPDRYIYDAVKKGADIPLPEKIEALEVEQSELHRLMGDGDFYRQSGDKITAALERLGAIKNELEVCYGRWETLEGLANSANT